MFAPLMKRKPEGTKVCGCGRTISANKEMCMECREKEENGHSVVGDSDTDNNPVVGVVGD